MEKYTGLVKAKERCFAGGGQHAPGDVFSVSDVVLYADDPFIALGDAPTVLPVSERFGGELQHGALRPIADIARDKAVNRGR
jgi:hypothetical protein